MKPLSRKHAAHPIELQHYHTFAAALRLALLDTAVINANQDDQSGSADCHAVANIHSSYPF